MEKIYYYILSILILFTACGQDDDPEVNQDSGVTIKIRVQKSLTTKVVDADNLASEQTINNISIFFTQPSSTAIVYKYVYTGFTISGDYQLISLPLEPADLLTKDIYVVANYDDPSALEALTSTDGINGLLTPKVDKTNNLDPLKGFCMYGYLLNFNFVTNADTPATIPLTRTCAKLRVNLTFPENPTLSTDNGFLITSAAKYTHVVKSATTVLPLSDYFNFAAILPLTNNGSQTYTGIAYVYEAGQGAGIVIYTRINNSITQQEFSATLPIPQRNHLYDLMIEVYEEEPTTVASLKSDPISRYTFKSTGTIFNQEGEKVGEF